MSTGRCRFGEGWSFHLETVSGEAACVKCRSLLRFLRRFGESWDPVSAGLPFVKPVEPRFLPVFSAKPLCQEQE